ncbi:hypothetical protein VP177E371_P0079 [Vibrio phage 177E37-1]|nr:hypothetical protein VP177E371_P0079 [Vibrio phage 177E37-1]
MTPSHPLHKYADLGNNYATDAYGNDYPCNISTAF